MKDGSRLTEHVRAGMRAHVRAQRWLEWGGGGLLTHLNGGLGAAICFSFHWRSVVFQQ